MYVVIVIWQSVKLLTVKYIFCDYSSWISFDKYIAGNVDVETHVNSLS